METRKLCSGMLHGKILKTMKNSTKGLFIAALFIFFSGFLQANYNESESDNKKPKISFTFDDGSTLNMPNYELKEWNQLILDNLKKHNIKAVFFATGSFLEGSNGNYVLSAWNDAGHKIANHTYSHPSFNSKKTTLESFKLELLRNDSIIKRFSNYFPLFRFPYLKEGNTIEKRDGFRKYLKDKNYKIGHVTIDASDWYVNSRLIKHLKKNPDSDLSVYKQFYIKHLYERACYYDSMAFQLTNRRIHHTLLLHHNLCSALFLDDLIKFFKDKGWEIINADLAYKDKIYENEPQNIPAGESLIWAIAKQSGKFEDILRYPAEDSRYEKPKMDELGL